MRPAHPERRPGADTLGPPDYDFSQHSPTTRPFAERTAGKAFLLSDRVQLFSAETRAKGIKGGSVGVFEAAQVGEVL